MGSSVTPLSGRLARFQGGVRELAPGTYAWLQSNGSWGEANAGLIVGDGEAMVIDTLWDESLAREMLEAMAQHVREAPIKTVLNTHSDGDHWWGNAAMPGEAQIITCGASRSAMERESSPHELARLAGLARLGRGLPGSFGALSRLIAEMLGPFDLADVRLRYPTRIFERELELQVGGRAVRLHVLGPAHTSSDTIAYLPDVRVVFAADLLFVGAIPVMWHGPTSSWLAALATMLTLDAEVFVPGHGDIAGRAGVESMQRFLRWLREAVEAYRERSRSALSITEELIRSSGFEEWRTWECPERLLISVVSVMRELSGEGPMTVTPAVRARLFRQIAVLKKRIEGG